MPVIKDESGQLWELIGQQPSEGDRFITYGLRASSRESQAFATEPDVVEESPERDMRKMENATYEHSDEFNHGYDAGYKAGRASNSTEPTSEHNTVEDRELAENRRCKNCGLLKYGHPICTCPTPTGERWRADRNELYWYVRDFREVNSTRDNYLTYDDDLYESGNYFKTPVQALAVAEAIKELLGLVNLNHNLNLYNYPPSLLFDLIEKARAVQEDSDG